MHKYSGKNQLSAKKYKIEAHYIFYMSAKINANKASDYHLI